MVAAAVAGLIALGMAEYRFCHAIEVRFADLDALRHVNNAAHFTHMEQDRRKCFERLGV